MDLGVLVPFLQLWLWLCSVEHTQSVVEFLQRTPEEFITGSRRILSSQDIGAQHQPLHLGRGFSEPLTLCPPTGQLRPGVGASPLHTLGKISWDLRTRTGIFL